MGIGAVKWESKKPAKEYSDREILEMLARIYGVGDQDQLKDRYSEREQ